MPWLFFIGLLFPAILKCQVTTKVDSSAIGKDTSRIWQGTVQLTETGANSLLPLYNALDRFQLYQPIYQRAFFNTNLSNNGTAWQHLTSHPIFSNGFNPGFQTFDIYYLRLNDTKWYDCQSPFTHAIYFQGPKEELNFNLVHTQNIGKQVNVGLNFKRTASEGLYQHQALNHQSILLHSWIRPLKLPYQALVAAYYNNGLVNENGGLSTGGDSLFRAGAESNRQLLPVNLNNARQRIFGNGFLLRQTYDLNKKDDSIQHGFLRVQHNLSYQFRKFHYEDQLSNPGYYAFIADSSLTGVNYSYRALDNEIALLRLFSGEKSNSFEAKLYFRQQLIDFSSSVNTAANQYGLHSINHSTGGFASLKFNPKSGLRMQADYFLSGFNQGDTRFALENWNITAGGMRIETAINWNLQEVNYQMQHFVSNFGSWNFNSSKVSNLYAEGRMLTSNAKFYFAFTLRQLKGYTYLDIGGKPVQFNQAVNLLGAYLYHRLNFGKWNLYSRAQFQLNNQNALMRLPAVQLQESIFREGRIGGKTTWRVGIDIFAVSSYRPNAYQVYSGLFYLQDTYLNKSLFEADFYVSAKIRRALAFIKLENFNAGWGGYRVIPVPGYPLNDLALKLGLSWMFFD